MLLKRFTLHPAINIDKKTSEYKSIFEEKSWLVDRRARYFFFLNLPFRNDIILTKCYCKKR